MGSVPTTIPLSPIGMVEARDGRLFRLAEEDIEGVRARTLLEYPDGMLLDWEHRSEDSFDANSKAAGWLDASSIRVEDYEGRRFCVVDLRWTEPGAESVAGQLYRFISPVFFPDFSDEESDLPGVLSFKGAALTNNPALRMPSLNEKQKNMSTDNQSNGVRAVLGLDKATSTEDLFSYLTATKEKAEAFDALKAEHDQLVPIYDAAKEQLSAANEELVKLRAQDAERVAVAFSERRGALIEKALKEGKIMPAQVESFTAIAKDDDGLKSLEGLFAVSPSLGLTKVSDAFKEPPTGDKRKATSGCKDVSEFAAKAGLPLGPARQIWNKENPK